MQPDRPTLGHLWLSAPGRHRGVVQNNLRLHHKTRTRQVIAACKTAGSTIHFPLPVVQPLLASLATTRRALILPILIDIHCPWRLMQNISIQPSLEVDEGVARVTGSRPIDSASLIVDNSTSLQSCINPSAAGCVPSYNEAKVEPPAANIFLVLIKQRFPTFVVAGDLQPSAFVAQSKNGVVRNTGRSFTKLPPLSNHQPFRSLWKIVGKVEAKRIDIGSAGARVQPPGLH